MYMYTIPVVFTEKYRPHRQEETEPNRKPSALAKLSVDYRHSEVRSSCVYFSSVAYVYFRVDTLVEPAVRS